jgi:adenylate cyclase
MPIKKRNLSDFSALTHLRVLGLMDVTLMIPSVPDESDARRVRTSLSSINEMGYGVADTLGTSDYLSLIDLVVPRFRGKDDECLIGLFDAGLQERPGGAKIIKFVVDHFVQRLTLELSRLRDEDASQGLRRTFLSLNRDWGNTVTFDFDRARKGSDVAGPGAGDRYNASTSTHGMVRASASAVVVYLYKKTLYVANVGDSMALIAGRTMLARDLTTKHEPCSTEEVQRIRGAEGWVSPDGLVNDQAKSARAFGAFHVFPAVNCEPTVHVLDLVDSDEFVIIANIGLWSVLSNQMAVDVVWEHKADPMLAAQKLRDLAIAYGADSSIVVMVGAPWSLIVLVTTTELTCLYAGGQCRGLVQE